MFNHIHVVTVIVNSYLNVMNQYQRKITFIAQLPVYEITSLKVWYSQFLFL